MRPRDQQAEKSSERRQRDDRENESDPLPRPKRGVQDERHQQDRDRNDDGEPSVRPLLALVFSCPVEVIALRQFHFLSNFVDRLTNGAAEIAPANAVLDRDIARISLAINRRSAVIERDVTELPQRDALARRSQQSDAGDVVDRPPELRLIANRKIEPLFANQDLADGFAAHRRFNRILYIGNVDPEAVGGGAVDIQIHIRLATYLKRAEVGNSRNTAHDPLNLVRLLLQRFQIAPEQFDRKFTLHAADGFFNVVRNRLREIPIDAGKLLKLPVHRGDELILVALELRPPLLARKKVNEELGVVEAAGVAAIVGASDLAHDLSDLGKIREHEACPLGHVDARRWPGARRECAANPDRTLVKMRQEFRPDNPAGREKNHYPERNQPHPERELQVIKTPVECP